MFKTAQKYFYISFLIVHCINASEDTDLARHLRRNFFELRAYIILNDPVIKHELPIHASIINSLALSNDDRIQKKLAIDQERKKFQNIIFSRTRSYLLTNNLATVFKIIDVDESVICKREYFKLLALEMASFPDRFPGARSFPEGFLEERTSRLALRRPRSQDSDAIEIILQADPADISPSTFISIL